ncbi:MAG: hypothetical protein ACJ8DY_00690, partial [Xanthobacteraceae bacterium]
MTGLLSVGCTFRPIGGLEMFKGLEKNNNAVAGAAAMPQPERSAVGQYASTLVPTPVSCIGSAMSIVGTVECSGA